MKDNWTKSKVIKNGTDTTRTINYINFHKKNSGTKFLLKKNRKGILRKIPKNRIGTVLRRREVRTKRV